MSVLSTPRVYFKGVCEWNPATTNNNDQWPTYDFTKADFNWSFLATQTPQITPSNITATFPSWVQTLQRYKSGDDEWQQPPSEWNYYGGNESTLYTTTTNQQTTITGGQTEFGGPILSDDPLVGAAVNIMGDAYPGSTTATLCRLVDINPDSFWCSDIYLRSVQIGNSAHPNWYLHGEVVPGTRMSSRWMFLQRNLNDDRKLEIAGVAGTVLQTCLPNASLQVNAATSNLLATLDKARHQPGVAGLMLRMSVYLTRYFSRSEFSDCTTKTEQYTRLVTLWRRALQEGRPPLQNPAISLIVGSLGLWMKDELVSVPGGRYLVPADCLTPNNAKPPPKSSPSFGPAVAELHSEQRVLSLDLGSTIPEIDSSCTKADYGPLTVRVRLPDGRALDLASLPSAAYGREQYEATAGIVDIPLPAGVTPTDVQSGALEVVAGSKVLLTDRGLSPFALSVQSDQRGIYLDQGQTGSLTIQVRQAGLPPTQPVNVLLQQYLPVPPPPVANGAAWTVPTSTQTPIISFLNAPENVIAVPVSANGSAEISFEPIRPGFPVIVFIPFLEGQPVPTPPQMIIPVFKPPDGTSAPHGPLTITSAFYSAVRVMPFDNALPTVFADLWNSTHDRQQAWNFVYGNVLRLYHLIFPVMKCYAGLNLGDQRTVDASIDLIVKLTSREMRDKTVYMPVTRDLSAGKRTVLQMYASLVANNWPEGPLAVPAGFASPSTPQGDVPAGAARR